MRVMVPVTATTGSEAGMMPPPSLFEAMRRSNEGLARPGIMLGGGGLTPSARGRRVAFDDLARRVIHGPFVETRDLEQAREQAFQQRCAAACPG